MLGAITIAVIVLSTLLCIFSEHKSSQEKLDALSLIKYVDCILSSCDSWNALIQKLKNDGSIEQKNTNFEAN